MVNAESSEKRSAASRSSAADGADVERCALCVLPRGAQAVSFSEESICGCCLAARRHGDNASEPQEDAGRLEEVIEKIRVRGRGRPYDCVVGLSGGRDSSYLVYLLTHKHGLRCLAASYLTPFSPETIEENIRRIVRTLNIPLVDMRISRDLHLKVARECLLLWRRHPLPALANLACASCKLVNREIFRVTKEHGCKSIVCGANKYELVQFLPAHQEADARERQSFTNQARIALGVFGKGTRLLLGHPVLMRRLPLFAKTSLLYLNAHTAFLQARYPNVYSVEYFYCAPWKESECVETIQSKLGWQLPPGCSTSWRADCDFAEVKEYMFHQMMGATYTDALLSNMIRAGEITREEALARLEAMSGLAWERIERAMDKLGLPPGLLKSAAGENA